MSISALILIIIVQGLVTFFTAWFLIKILRAGKKVRHDQGMDKPAPVD